MAIDELRLLNALREFTLAGKGVAALDLHLDALIGARDGDIARSSTSFIAAQQWESAQGYSDDALHTAHQMALVVNFGGDVAKLDAYYHETTVTLSKMRNRKGVALCLRSVGEIAMVKPDTTELARAWDLSERLFVMVNAPEAAQMATWRTVVQELLNI